jgi:hypothetical protein
MNGIRLLAALLLAGLAVAGPPVARAVDGDASITLGTDPEPPVSVENPGGIVTIFWTVEHTVTPQSVIYRLTDPAAAIVEEEVYPGATGLVVSREWTVPEGAPGGSYLVRIEFYSDEHGLEATAEVIFWVGEAPTSTLKATWGRIKALLGS